jgi:uncharacterized protein
VNLFLTIVVALAAAFVGWRVPLPGAAVVLPILAVVVLRSLRPSEIVPAPAWLQIVAFGLVGTIIGLGIDRASLLQARADWPVLALMACSVYIAASLASVVIGRLAGIDPVTALLAGSPGGLTGVAALGVSSGATLSQIVAVQTMRLFLVYVSLPPLIAVVRHFRPRQ